MMMTTAMMTLIQIIICRCITSHLDDDDINEDDDDDGDDTNYDLKVYHQPPRPEAGLCYLALWGAGDFNNDHHDALYYDDGDDDYNEDNDDQVTIIALVHQGAGDSSLDHCSLWCNELQCMKMPTMHENKTMYKNANHVWKQNYIVQIQMLLDLGPSLQFSSCCSSATPRYIYYLWLGWWLGRWVGE